MRENNRFTNSNFKEIFGELQSVHRVRRDKFQTVVIPSILFLLFLGSVVVYKESQDFFAIPVCVVPTLLLFGGIVWHLFSTRKDELRIYKNGFTHKGGKNLQSCLWTEVKRYHQRELNDQEIQEVSELKTEFVPLASIEKKNGEAIEFENDLPGTTEVYKRICRSK